MWPYLWIAFMVGLIAAVVVAAMREKKARTQALSKLKPQPMVDDPAMTGMPAADDGFGESDPLDSFGESAGEVAAFDENEFK